MLLASCGIALADDPTRHPSIIEGDTLEIHGNRIRLRGVDAPATYQLRRGENSKQYRCGAQPAYHPDAGHDVWVRTINRSCRRFNWPLRGIPRQARW